ncbi:MAG: hypothetical protein QOI24_4099 [Acidobacteriota bacterium]|jgi:uncharacterized membrane protein|nr:hypothetical protein [Acidobacteriota bacterium]
MPNWLYLLFNVLYHLGLSIWVGGTIVLGALTAPALFRALPRPQAGAIFGTILRRFARVRVAALIAIVVGAGAKYVMWETHAISPWIVVRWLMIAFLAVSLIIEIVILEPQLEARRVLLTPDMTADDPQRAAFNVLHRRAENLLRLALLAAVVALFFS